MADFNPDINTELYGPLEEETLETFIEVYNTVKYILTGKTPVRKADTISERVKEAYGIDKDDPRYSMALANYIASGRR